MAFCQNCGNELTGAAQFCPNCGERIAGTPSAPPPQQPSAAYTEGQQQPPQQASHQSPQHSGMSATGAMGAAAGGAMGGWMGGQPPAMQQPPAQADPYHAPAPMQQPPYQAAQQQMGAFGGAAAGQPPSAESLKDMFFSYHGRLNRKRYILRGLLVYVLMSLANGVMGIMTESSSTGLHIMALLLLPVVLVGCVSSFMLTIRRWHDLGKSGWYTLLVLIPLVNFFIAIYLWVKKGTDGPNAYGEDPLA